MTDRELLYKLNQASVCCADCGEKYGVHSVGYSSWWNGKCHVCEQQAPVTESRDYAYFFPLRRRLLKQLQASSKIKDL
jgi:hypothetical protein